jgi:hypothetical protein
MARLQPTLRVFSQPRWSGKEDLEGKTILLYGEQGLGDTIQFCRYVEKVAALGATVIFEVRPALMSLLRDLPGVNRLIENGESLPDFDYQCPLLSLPLAFNTNLDSIPSSPKYLASDPVLTKNWQSKLGAKTKLRVGLAWTGNPNNPNDHPRSMPLVQLEPLLSEDMEFFAMQKDIRPSDLDALGRSGIKHVGGDLSDFYEIAAFVECMDLIVTVDTSFAHLAGALGKPVWILLQFVPDWRWLLDRSDSPWYPTARLFRQNVAGDWTSVIHEVQNELAQLLS